MMVTIYYLITWLFISFVLPEFYFLAMKKLFCHPFRNMGILLLRRRDQASHYFIIDVVILSLCKLMWQTSTSAV